MPFCVVVIAIVLIFLSVDALLQDVFPAHAYDVEKDLPLGVYDWNRGIRWYI